MGFELRGRARVPEDEQAEVPVASEDDSVAVLVFRQSNSPEVVPLRVDVVADFLDPGRVEGGHPEPARVPGEVRELPVVRSGATLVRVAARHLDLVDGEVTEALVEGRIDGHRDGELVDLGEAASR